MKIFEFEQKMQSENDNSVNLIYRNSKGFHINTLKGRSSISEVVKGNITIYKDLEDLKTTSDQFSKFENYNTFVVDTRKHTDAAKWEIEEIISFKKIKNRMSLTDDDIAEMFSYKSKLAYANSSAKSRIEKGLTEFYLKVKKSVI